MTRQEISTEIGRLAGVVRGLRDQVAGGGTRQQTQEWLSQQQDALKQIRALQRSSGSNLPALQKQRAASASALTQSAKKRLSGQQRFGALARLSRSDLDTLFNVHSMWRQLGHGQSLRRQPAQDADQVRREQESAMREVPRLQRTALQHNHEMFEQARMLVDPQEVEDLLMRGIDAQVDVDAVDHAAGRVRDMMVPARPQQEEPTIQPLSQQTLPSRADVLKSVQTWHERETASNARMRGRVRSALDLVDYQALMAPELSLPARQREEDVRAQQDAGRGGIPGARRPTPDFAEVLSPDLDPEARTYVETVRATAAEEMRRLTQEQETDYDQLAGIDAEIVRVSTQRGAAAPENRPQYDSLMRTLAAERMTVGRRLTARQRMLQTYDAERARESVILHPDLIEEGDDLWNAEGDLELMFSGRRARAPETPVTTGPPAGAPIPEAIDVRVGVRGQAYTVRADDTLSEIAAQMGTSVDELAAANNIEDPNLIFPGDTINMPGADGDAAAHSADEPFPADAQITPVPEAGLPTDVWDDTELAETLQREAGTEADRMLPMPRPGRPRSRRTQERMKRVPKVYRDANLPTNALIEMPWPARDRAAQRAKAAVFTITMREEGSIRGFTTDGTPEYVLSPKDSVYGGFYKEEGRVLVKPYKDNGWSVGNGMWFQTREEADAFAATLNTRIKGGEPLMHVLMDNDKFRTHWAPVQEAIDAGLLQNRRQVAGALSMVWQGGFAMHDDPGVKNPGAWSYVEQYFAGERNLWSAIRNALRTKTTVGGKYGEDGGWGVLNRRSRELSLALDIPEEEIRSGMKISQWRGKGYNEVKPLADAAQAEQGAAGAPPEDTA